MKYKQTGMKCPDCGRTLAEIPVSVEGAKSKILSHQCGKCGYFRFEDNSTKTVVEELKAKEQALKIQQKLVNLSHNRLGAYFNKHIVRSLKLKAGQDIFLSVPDKKHILISLKE